MCRNMRYLSPQVPGFLNCKNGTIKYKLFLPANVRTGAVYCNISENHIIFCRRVLDDKYYCAEKMNELG